MKALNLPSYEFKVKYRENKQLIFDPIRKKYLVLTPEEWVRQHFVNYLIKHKKYPATLIGLEKKVMLNGMLRRTDILVFNKRAEPYIIVECKAPSVNIDQKTFDQVARYNAKLNAKYIIVTNGLVHYYCIVDSKSEKYVFLREIPDYI
ncbi:MAG: type I restriction enzyme HsdR N-terminal domain-containing protein [Flavobacteriaceae bacterium]|nr:type I restriction enzyme HsdR N-terminal domain-containing protein [Flavobacteriaceae bacterium]